MNVFITYVLIFCIIMAAGVILFDFFKYRRIKRSLIELASLMLVLVLLRITTGFPTPVQTFGGYSPERAILLMLVAVIAGIVSNYFFHLKEKFNWLTFIKPLFISPIVVLPLIGTVNNTQIETIQLVSLILIAFQNGFFWKEVYNKAQKSI